MVIVSIFKIGQWDFWIAGSHYSATPKTAKTVTNWCASEGADLCFNLALFNMSNYATVTYAHSKIGDIGYGGRSELIKINPFYYCKGYSSGISNNRVYVNAPLGGSRTRNGIGLTDKGDIIIAQCDTRMREAAFCRSVLRIANKQGAYVKSFVLEDGGGSTAHYSSRSKLLFAPEGGRRVPTVLCAKAKNLPKITRTLSRGCKGEDVRILQQVIGGIEVDGSYGAGRTGTVQRVKSAQKALGLPQTGIADRRTLDALGL